jgi:hypothetical protein
MEGGENRWKYWVHTVELILQGHRRRYVGVQKFAQRLRIKSELMQFTGDFLETFLKLTVGNCMINPMGGKIWVLYVREKYAYLEGNLDVNHYVQTHRDLDKP